MPTYMTETVLTDQVTIKVTPAQRQWLKDEARRQKRPINHIVRLLIDEAMEEGESYTKAP